MFPVRYELNHKAANLILQGCAVAQSVSRRPVTVEARFRCQASLFEICGGQSGNRTGFLLVFQFYAVNFQSSSKPYLYSSTCYSYYDKRAIPETFERKMPFRKLGITV